jgi:hypothetical protein
MQLKILHIEKGKERKNVVAARKNATFSSIMAI